MAEEAQELTVTNTGQPIAVEIEPVDTYEVAQEIRAAEPADVTVDLTPVDG